MSSIIDRGLVKSIIPGLISGIILMLLFKGVTCIWNLELTIPQKLGIYAFISITSLAVILWYYFKVNPFTIRGLKHIRLYIKGYRCKRLTPEEIFNRYGGRNKFIGKNDFYIPWIEIFRNKEVLLKEEDFPAEIVRDEKGNCKKHKRHNLYPAHLDPSIIEDVLAFYVRGRVWDNPTGRFIECEKKDSACLFSWDNVPGPDSESLLKFFMDKLGICWAENAEISKSYDGKTIYISKDKNSAEIIINKEKEKAILKISDGKTHDLKVKKVDGKLNIYAKSKVVLYFEATTYFDYLVSNLYIDTFVPSLGTTIRECLEPYGWEDALKDPRSANHAGITALLLCSNNKLILLHNRSDNATYPNEICASTSGTLELGDLVDGSKPSPPFEALRREMYEELHFPKCDLEELRRLAIARDMTRGGSPEFIFFAKTCLSSGEVRDLFSRAYRTDKIQPHEIKSIQEEGFDDSHDKYLHFSRKLKDQKFNLPAMAAVYYYEELIMKRN